MTGFKTAASTAPATPARRQRGLSYIEVVVATLLLVAALVPAYDALYTGFVGNVVHAAEAAGQQRLRAKMEEVLAKPFTALYATTYASGGNSPTAVVANLSDPVGPDRRVVNLYRVDGAVASTADTGLLRIVVSYESGGPTLETLKGRWW